MNKLKLTAAQAVVRYLSVQSVADDHGNILPMFNGVFAIFGHGNVAGLGLALQEFKQVLPTYRGHNEQSMAHAAIAYAKANNRRRMMACTSSIGPGATNMVTACALAHVNRLPVLFLPGDSYASRRPDPVLQQVEVFSDPTLTANDCFKPVSRYFDRIMRAEQLITSLPVAIQTLTDAENCGPVTLSMPQDVQAMAYDYPESMFSNKVHHFIRRDADDHQLRQVLALLNNAKRPLIIAGGGVVYSLAHENLSQFAKQRQIPVALTQAGYGALPFDHPCNVGAIGVTGTSSANTLASEADVIVAIGTRLQDFTTGSRRLFNQDAALIQLNVGRYDAIKHNATALICDAKLGIIAIMKNLGEYQATPSWVDRASTLTCQWNQAADQLTAITDTDRPSDAQVIGAVNRHCEDNAIVVCAAGGLPGELHKHWRCKNIDGYHLEYGFSCMGYEIAGGLGVKMANQEKPVYVLVGDGSYLMLNSEIATSITLGLKLIIIVLDNRGFGCINRLQKSVGGESFNNLFDEGTVGEMPDIDFAAHAQALGAHAESVTGITELESAIQRAKDVRKTVVISLKTDAIESSEIGGCWWDVAIAETNPKESVNKARFNYESVIKKLPI